MKENEWRINNKDSQLLTDELQVAESFNEFFVEKVELLKQGIDKTLVEDPFTKLKQKMADNKTKLEFKTITQKQLKIHLFIW